ncbi:MAG TPA: hypothetical protein RMG48_02210 [Myxococcales bacterium LLY-WYZ-16_1]|nr:hypothetical protein [Myxococcales bacterium LLY-WYZ-16_1]
MLALGAAGLGDGCRHAPDPELDTPVELGQPFRFSSWDRTGRRVTDSDLRGRPAVLLFAGVDRWGKGVPREFVDLWLRLQEPAWRLVWVTASATADVLGAPQPHVTLQDRDGALMRRAGGGPTALLLDAHGVVVFRTPPGQPVARSVLEPVLRRSLGRLAR